MREREALLKAVCDSPEDDTPRLVYADWLDEHGEPERAEFIRTQCELARGAKGRRRAALAAREAELLAAHAAEWVEPLRAFLYEDWSATPYVFRRGFVEQIDVLGETLVESGAELFASAPVRGVRMPDEEEFDQLARCRHLLRLRSIDLTASGLSAGYGPAPLFRSRYLANLTTLIARGYDDNAHLDVAGIRGITASKHLGGLRHLDVGHNWFGPEGTAELLRADNLNSLESLGLSGVGTEDEGALAVAETPWVGRLKRLDLYGNGIGERGARALLESPHLEQVEELDLRGNRTERREYDTPEDGDPISPATSRGLRRRFGKRVLL